MSQYVCDCCKIEFDSLGELAEHEKKIGVIGDD